MMKGANKRDDNDNLSFGSKVRPNNTKNTITEFDE